ncbi:MAG: hypothetical protein AAB539_03545 [Patescibacteria group bacterium]
MVSPYKVQDEKIKDAEYAFKRDRHSTAALRSSGGFLFEAII